MPNVAIIEPEHATGRARELYDSGRAATVAWGGPEYIQLNRTWSLQPEIADAWLNLRVIAKERAGIDEREYELMLCRVVYLYKCRYVTVNHSKILSHVAGYSHEQVVNYVRRPEASDLSQRDKALLRFAEKVALRSHQVIRQDVEQLLEEGFTEANAVALIFLIGWLVSDAIVPNALGPDPDQYSKGFRDVPDWQKAT